MTDTELSHALLTSDFYSFQDLLTPDENQRVLEIREFLERDLRPVADDYWDRAEFPMHLDPRGRPARPAGAGLAGDQAVREQRRSTAAGSRSSWRASTPGSRRSSACRTA